MKLSIPERLLLLNVLPPAEGNFIFLRAVRTFREDLGFSENEALAVGIQQTPQQITWNNAKEDPMKEIPMGPGVARWVSDRIKSAPKLQEGWMAVLEKFVQEDSNA